jgi:hypothetical protein
MDQQVENLWFQRNGRVLSPKLPPVVIQREALEQVAHSLPQKNRQSMALA